MAASGAKLAWQDPQSNSCLLKKEFAKQISSLIGKPSTFELCYKISRDGCSSQTFHRMCDGRGPTVTVLYSVDGSVLGGYLSQSWNNSNAYINDKQAFLFHFPSNGQFCPVKYSIQNPAMAAYGAHNFGPTFGGSNQGQFLVNTRCAQQIIAEPMQPHSQNGFDLQTFRGNVMKKLDQRRYFCLNGNIAFGNAFANTSYDNMCWMSKSNLQVTDLEVYLVKDEKKTNFQAIPSTDMEPWREIPQWDAHTHVSLKEYIINYKPLDDMDVSAVNILLIGQVGAGKSSFFNTVNSIFRGDITARASAGNSQHSLTTSDEPEAYRRTIVSGADESPGKWHFVKYRIRVPSNGTYLNFKLCDTRGLEEDMSIHLQDITMVLDGLLPEHYKFNPAAPATARSPGIKKFAALKDKIHCVAFVVDGSTVGLMNDGVQEKIKYLQQLLVERGIPQVVYLTKLDRLCPSVDQDIRAVFYSAECKTALETAADVIGVPRSHVFPVKNYEKETNLSIQVNILVLRALKQTLVFADDYLEDQFEILQTDLP